jgi:hypothetical protein
MISLSFSKLLNITISSYKFILKWEKMKKLRQYLDKLALFTNKIIKDKNKNKLLKIISNRYRFLKESEMKFR